jgi:hypothetical protein
MNEYVETKDRIKAERKARVDMVFHWKGKEIDKEIDLINNDSTVFSEKIVFIR